MKRTRHTPEQVIRKLREADRMLAEGSSVAAVAMLCDRLGVSELWACRVTGQHRSTQRREATPAADDEALRGELRAFSARRPRWGYRQAHTHLRDQGWEINRKRVQRVWREEGLRVSQRTRKRRRLGSSTAPEARLRAERPGHVWAFDFQFDQTADGHVLELLNVVDEFTREALVVHTARSISADQTVAVLQALVAVARRRTSAATTARR